MDSISGAKKFLRNNFEKGTKCPCCGQFVRLYKRKLNTSMARALVWIVGESRKSPNQWVDLPANAPQWMTRSREHPKLRWWGLLEQMPNVDESKKHSGIWRPTEKGILFAIGKTKVPEYILQYNNKVISHSEETFTIQKAFGVRFNYEEMMRETDLLPLLEKFPPSNASREGVDTRAQMNLELRLFRDHWWSIDPFA